MTIEAITVATVDLSQLDWRKSSRSGQDHTNGNCVEVAFTRAEWRKSSHSSQDGSNGNCVEVAIVSRWRSPDLLWRCVTPSHQMLAPWCFRHTDG